jgi:hypothetical protein
MDPNAQPIERTLPFGLGATTGCCPTVTDPAGVCKGPCGAEICVNKQTPDVEAQCPAASATCPPACNTAGMTHEYCADACWGLGYAVSGIEYGNQCLCGHQLAPFALEETGRDLSEAECKQASERASDWCSLLHLQQQVGWLAGLACWLAWLAGWLRQLMHVCGWLQQLLTRKPGAVLLCVVHNVCACAQRCCRQERL